MSDMDFTSSLLLINPPTLTTALGWTILIAASLFTTKIILTAIYNVTFHPLAKLPGPKFPSAFPLPNTFYHLNGRMIDWYCSLHEKYGGIVRISPNELSIIHASAWQDLYARRPEFVKPEMPLLRQKSDVSSMIATSSIENHTRQRRIVSHGFSDKALRDQECILQQYTDFLVQRLRDQVSVGETSADVDITKWYNFVVFDIIGELCLGESFHSLKNGADHIWITTLGTAMRFSGAMMGIRAWLPLDNLLRFCLPKSTKEKLREHLEWIIGKIDKRIAEDTDRPDFMSYILRNNHSKGMSLDEMHATVPTLIAAGSETSATNLAAVTWFMLQNPTMMERLKQEIRDSFTKDEDITVAAVSQLPYLHAVMQETLRIHPPVPFGSARLIPREGAMISGHWIPGGTSVRLTHKPAYHSLLNFVDPLSYVPERWLPEADPRFASDRKDIFQPFGVGPRNCVGERLAWAEMKLIFSSIIWNFDLELAPGNVRDWTDQKVYVVHLKGPLYVKLTPRFGGEKRA